MKRAVTLLIEYETDARILPPVRPGRQPRKLFTATVDGITVSRPTLAEAVGAAILNRLRYADELQVPATAEGGAR